MINSKEKTQERFRGINSFIWQRILKFYFCFALLQVPKKLEPALDPRDKVKQKLFVSSTSEPSDMSDISATADIRPENGSASTQSSRMVSQVLLNYKRCLF